MTSIEETVPLELVIICPAIEEFNSPAVNHNVIDVTMFTSDSLKKGKKRKAGGLFNAPCLRLNKYFCYILSRRKASCDPPSPFYHYKWMQPGQYYDIMFKICLMMNSGVWQRKQRL